MKKLVVLVAILAVIVQAQFRGPKIKYAHETYDFGTIKQGEIVKHSFLIMNDGDDTLKITNVVTSCGCTAFDVSKRELIPGETVSLNVEFNSHGRIGQQTKYISIASNDKEKPSSSVILKGVVSEESFEKPMNAEVPKIEFPESQHDFGVIQEGKIVDYTFAFKNTGKKDLEIRDIRTSCGCTAALVSQKLLKPGEAGTLKIELDTSNRFGRMSRTISVTTNEIEAPVKVLTIYAEVVKKEVN
ncbi:MAG: DUF1573 domain-containing protein [Ignavibacteriales bacterium]|nr:DUF1573 domain-containing protein [Ignavibacteriales bacterium]